MSAKEKLRKLAAEAPIKNKTAYVRSLLPEIETALARGVKSETIAEELRKDSGLEFTAKRLHAILSRLRKEQDASRDAREAEEARVRELLATRLKPPERQVAQRAATEGRSAFQHDPNADVKEWI